MATPDHVQDALQAQAIFTVAYLFCNGALPKRLLEWTYEATNAQYEHLSNTLARKLSIILPASQLKDTAARLKECVDCPSAVPSPSQHEWVVNMVLLYMATTGQTATFEIRKSQPLPLIELCDALKDVLGDDVKIPDVGRALIKASQALTPAERTRCGSNIPDFAVYFNICPSALDETTRRQLLKPFADFHDEYLQYCPPRTSPKFMQYSIPFEVADIEDAAVDYIDHTTPSGKNVREWRPKEVPVSGLDTIAIFWVAGGGWYYGDHGSDAHVASQVCQRTRRRVYVVDYARKTPFPAAHLDVVMGACWVLNQEGVQQIDIVGVSSGAFEAMSLALQKHTTPIRKLYLVGGLFDNTFMAVERWTSVRLVTWPSIPMMQNYQDSYFKAEDRSKDNWHVSPIYAPDEILQRLKCEVHIAGLEVDVLFPEGVEFVSRLERAGCDVKFHKFDGHPHSALLQQGLDDRLLTHIVSILQR